MKNLTKFFAFSMLFSMASLTGMERPGNARALIKQKQAALFEKYTTIGQCEGAQNSLRSLQLTSAFNAITDLYTAYEYPVTSPYTLGSAAAHFLLCIALFKVHNELEKKKWNARKELPALISALINRETEVTKEKRKTVAELHKEASQQQAESGTLLLGDLLSTINVIKISYIGHAIDAQGPCDPALYSILNFQILTQELSALASFVFACQAGMQRYNTDRKIDAMLQQLDSLIERGVREPQQ